MFLFEHLIKQDQIRWPPKLTVNAHSTGPEVDKGKSLNFEGISVNP